MALSSTQRRVLHKAVRSRRVLSNIYLHFLLDLWFEKKIKPACRGEAYLVRFADDFVATFQYREDVDRFQTQVREKVCRIRAGAGRGKDSGHTLRALCGHHTAALWTGKTGDFRVSGLQTCLWGGSIGALCLVSHPQRQELSEVLDTHTGMDL